jgi:hypothetical protein
VARRLTSALAATAVLLAGCGAAKHKPSASETAVRTTLQAYLTSFAHRDYDGACAWLTHRAKVRIARRSRAPTLNLNQAGCPAQLAALAATVPGPQRGAVLEVLSGARIGSISVQGARATATLRATFGGRTQSQPVELRRAAGVWLVDASPSPAS